MSKMKIVFYTCAFAALLFSSACKKSLGREEFVKQVAADHDYERVTESGDIKVSCTYRPAKLLAISELSNRGDSLSSAMLDGEVKKFSNAFYFDLVISDRNGESLLQKGIKTQEEYAARVSDLTYNMARDIYLLGNAGDTIRLHTYTFMNSYGMSKNVRLMLAFPAEKVSAQNSISIVYKDKIFGINNDIRFSYNTSDLNKTLPEIKY